MNNDAGKPNRFDADKVTSHVPFDVRQMAREIIASDTIRICIGDKMHVMRSDVAKHVLCELLRFL